MDNNGIDPNAGAAGDPSLGTPDLGGQGDQGSQPSGSQGQGGQGNPDTGNTELEQLKANNRALNKALIEARRGQSRQNPQQPQGDEDPFGTPQGQYAISLQLATGKLTQGLESVFDLYPEIPASEVKQIRKNPWAYASQDSYMAGDFNTAMLEVEQYLLDRATELSGGQGNGNVVPSQQKQVPAQMNPNPPTEQAVDADPGSAEDENLWTMPMDKLEKVKNKQLAQKSNAQR